MVMIIHKNFHQQDGRDKIKQVIIIMDKNHIKNKCHKLKVIYKYGLNLIWII